MVVIPQTLSSAFVEEKERENGVEGPNLLKEEHIKLLVSLLKKSD